MLRSETDGAPARIAAALRGLRRYQQAERRSAPQRPEIARVGRAAIREFDGSGPPVLFVPSLINPPHVLDIDAERSMLGWLAKQGLRPLLLDWGTPLPEERALDVGGHVETMLLPLIDAIGEPVALAGYCLGGTMTIAAAHHRPVRALVTMAAPWNFAGYPVADRKAIGDLWIQAAPMVETLGAMPMDVLQTAFWRLDPTRTITKYEALGTEAEPSPEELQSFVRLEDWANDGPPLTLAAARQLLADFYVGDAPGSGAWQVGGRTIDPASLGLPILEIASTTDRIVPHASAAGVGTRIDLALGHVGMIVGGRARTHLWEPLRVWLSDTLGS